MSIATDDEDIGDYYRAKREQSKAKRASNREQSTQIRSRAAFIGMRAALESIK